ncbi:MAG: D-aminoacyl-tRNA deacylase [Bacilli bacterium]|nr:D-aminoacyl-tRNA deacylase [Bacilli bacterium]MDD3305418.1 D-aminoacyl-tRNA deacylase [Bacilli bacterium]MDD4054024.1 D-aminoacyl-tRNA deacylase [Bacilli bacterium]MDD4411772.1 D-aminoacyl-tRNA deacylase [Bacilli bacterium]
MRVIIQRVSEASVRVDNKVAGFIQAGFVLFVGFTHDDNIDDLKYIINKIKFIRLFDDDNGIMNIDINDIGGSILSISQFTLYANASKGRRPSYTKAMKYNEAEEFYNQFNKMLIEEGLKVEKGIFGGDMKVSLVNDGPITIILDSKEGNYEKA